MFYLFNTVQQGMAVYAYASNTQERGENWVDFRTILGFRVRLCLKKKKNYSKDLVET